MPEKFITLAAFERLLYRTGAGQETGPREPGEQTQEELLQRRQAAQLVHTYLKQTLLEADEEHFDAAGRLRDLYDCHICVNHVAQVYVKGIMTAMQERGQPVFGMRQLVTEQEAQEIVERVYDKSKRLAVEEVGTGNSEKLDKDEALKRLANLRGAVLLDVRPTSEYAKGTIPGAKNLPLATFLQNPYLAAEDVLTPLFFYCEEGYQSRIAANCAVDAGFRQVHYFGNDEG